MSSSESDDEHILSRLFGVRRGQTRHSRKGHGDGSRLFSYLHVPKKLQRWGDSDSDDDYSSSPSSPPSPSHAQAASIALPPSPPGSQPSPPSPSHAQAASIALPPSPPGSQPSSRKNKSPPPLKHEPNAFQAQPVVGSDAPAAPPMKPKKVNEAKYPEPVVTDAPNAPPMAPPMTPPPPNAPPMGADANKSGTATMSKPMENAANKIVNNMESAGLLDGIKKRGESKRIAREICVDIVNNAINPLIGKGSLTRAEGAEVKHTMYNAVVKTMNKPEASKDDVMAEIRSGAAHLKPVRDRKLNAVQLTKQEKEEQQAIEQAAARRKALSPDGEDEVSDSEWAE